ncbi:MAG: RNA-binding S4 domain-containing protein [Bacteroidales bacterium]|nr:RNA-binding S4 domain-containing protein [Bacteroidales bacterium]
MMKFELNADYLELNKLLKTTQIAQTGGHAKILISEGSVIRNGEVETRIRAKIVKGDKIEVEGKIIEVV